MHSLKTLFTLENLKQASTIKAVIGFAVSIGLVYMSPDQQQQLASLALRFIAGITNLLAVAHALYALINLVTDENKHASLPTETTTKG